MVSVSGPELYHGIDTFYMFTPHVKFISHVNTHMKIFVIMFKCLSTLLSYLSKHLRSRENCKIKKGNVIIIIDC